MALQEVFSRGFIGFVVWKISRPHFLYPSFSSLLHHFSHVMILIRDIVRVPEEEETTQIPTIWGECHGD